MTNSNGLNLEITPDVLLKAYACGIFPMAESADDPGLYWIEPERRGIIPLDRFHVPKRLAKLVRQERYEVKVDYDFRSILSGCASPSSGRPHTWINERIRALYVGLFDMGHAHSIETYLNGELAGGLYGVRLSGAFFGESMFSAARDASKVALVHLAARLRLGGFTLLDAQFMTTHLSQFGAIEISRKRYQSELDAALKTRGDFDASLTISGLDALTALRCD